VFVVVRHRVTSVTRPSASIVCLDLCACGEIVVKVLAVESKLRVVVLRFAIVVSVCVARFPPASFVMLLDLVIVMLGESGSLRSAL
jgi:hypothetical protein